MPAEPPPKTPQHSVPKQKASKQRAPKQRAHDSISSEIISSQRILPQRISPQLMQPHSRITQRLFVDVAEIFTVLREAGYAGDNSQASPGDSGEVIMLNRRARAEALATDRSAASQAGISGFEAKAAVSSVLQFLRRPSLIASLTILELRQKPNGRLGVSGHLIRGVAALQHAGQTCLAHERYKIFRVDRQLVTEADAALYAGAMALSFIRDRQRFDPCAGPLR